MNLIIPPNIKYSTSSDFTYQVLYTNILHWNLVPGEVIKDGDISKALGISRTPVREAINALRADTLIDVGSSTRVSLIDPKMLFQGSHIRTALEMLVSEEICGKLTPTQMGILKENLERQHMIVNGNIGKKSFYDLDTEFHKLFYTFADREFSYSIMSKSCMHSNRLRYWTFNKTHIDLESIYHLHCQMYDAAVNGDTAELAKLNREHTFFTHVKYHAPQISKTLLAEHPEYFTDPEEMLEITRKMESIMTRDWSI